ncbi:N-acetylmuramoyl-L-alanine amidase [Desulfoluna spongiiphila]|uniref:N-acetylmuramoyl-L-alanine amidase n=1 Tax=Desulfoluna spongiiphila TaxID=419481 RepID=UPI001259CB4B|nr:N-acetylmuramoyl-L-alanine amidase [Desulfoluna spongiiphila]VVS93689.1 n-acetylmuramoyl-l-alanine amidase catalytic domain [Desulfoluna spongiiphila]
MLILLDAGHGGVIDGVYQTPGKRSPKWSDGSQLFEGEFNRWIVNGLSERLSRRHIPYVLIAPEQRDVTLRTRVNRANRYKGRPSLFVSVHANAGGGSGFEVFTSRGTTQSDAAAHCFGQEFVREFPEKPLRADLRDGEYDKDRNFFVLKNTAMPAVLTENFFMDNEEECRQLLMSVEGRQRIVDYHERAIVRCVEGHV